MKVLAMSLKTFSVYAVPREIEKKQETVRKLAAVIAIDYDETLRKLNSDKSFVWIKRRISDEEAGAVSALGLEGVDLVKESKRYYPNKKLGSHVIGFAGVDERGLDGIELWYDRYLNGQPGRRSLLRDAKQRMMPAFEYEMIPAVDGYNAVLTIDEVMQHIVEQELDAAFEKYHAIGASVIVMNPETGEIYALANRPSYDLNEFKNATPAQRRNRALCDYFEPGSTFKIVTASAALEEKIAAPNDVFFCENGAYRVANHTLHDHTPHGTLTFVEVIERSSNIGVVKIAQKLGDKLLYAYVKKFSFGAKTGIDLPGEAAGFIRPLHQWSKLSIAAVPIGHEIGVTALQMTRAIAVIANGGYLVKPWILRHITDKNGEIIKDFSSDERTPVIAPETANTMKRILSGVVMNGTAKTARINGYSSAGKTGTAQKIDSSGTYSHNKFVASFIGFAPVDKPRFVIAFIFDEPRPVYYGGIVCAPVFKNIAEKILKYLNVPEEKQPASVQNNDNRGVD
jgi:cell division protein FtsI (penicillin-binding protein 3)